MNMKKIYLDNQATTSLDLQVFEAMTPYFTDIYGNASSQHQFGREALKGIDKAREQTAKAINASSNEIYFTASGSESNNWAIKGLVAANRNRGNHIVTTSIEHPSLMRSCKYLEEKGYKVTYLPVDKYGIINLDDLKNAITDKTVLVSVMTANNEIGSIQDIVSIGKFLKSKNILFHTDAVQAVGSIDVDVKEMQVDALSLSAHKFHGPKGVGALYLRNGVKIEKFISGGEQERSLRAGTYNTPGIVGLGKAIELATGPQAKHTRENIRKLRDYFVSEVQSKISDVIFNGPCDLNKRLASNASFSFKFVEGESLLMLLDLKGIAVSSGSACSSGTLDPSYVLLATGLPVEFSHGTIRFSFGKDNTKEETDYVIENLIEIVDRLRQISPLYSK